MKKFFIFPVLTKALVIQAMVVLLGMIIIIVSLVGLYRYKATENLKTNSSDQIQIIKAAIMQPLWTLDRNTLKQIVDSILLQRSGSIAAIRILDVDTTPENPKIVLNEFSQSWPDAPFENFKNNEQFISLETPVVFKANHLGTLQVIFSVAEHKKEIAQVSFLLGSALSFLTALFLSLIFMLHLRRLSHELQRQVEERTQELDSQRMAMVNSSRLASLGEMSAGIAHEINNPLAVIDGTIRLMSRLIVNMPDYEKLETYLNKISKMVVRISKIINGLRAFSRDGSQESMTQFMVNRFFSDLSDLCHANLANKKVNIEFQMDDQDAVLFGREVQLSQVMINMINNSADAVENLDEKWIKVECTQDSEHIILSVTDSGTGIPLDIQKKMLLPFYTTKELGKGTGLGLSISVGIIESHGGKLSYVHSSKNTCFEIRLKRLVPFRMSSTA